MPVALPRSAGNKENFASWRARRSDMNGSFASPRAQVHGVKLEKAMLNSVKSCAAFVLPLVKVAVMDLEVDLSVSSGGKLCYSVQAQISDE
eukprot:1448452-Pyramimonas_sp.AAC.1